MSSNAPAMTLEQRIVQNLKDDTLMKLVGDEDAMTELVKRAVHEALFKSRTVRDGSYSTKEVDTPVVEAARATAARLAQAAVDEVLSSPENRRRVLDAIVDLLPAAITGYLSGAVGSLVNTASNDAIRRVMELKQQNFL
jgi:hypothetical protein